MLLSDFPMATLQPIFRAVPALQNAAPAVTAGGPGAAMFGGPNMSGSNPFSGLAWPFMKGGNNMKGLGVRKAMGYNMSSITNSPVNGLLYVRGKISGSAQAPQGDVSIRLLDGAIGPTRLDIAEAQAAIDASQRLDFNIELAPAEPRASGHVKASGTVPLAELSGSTAAGEPMDVRVDVKDSGMMIVTTVTPEFRWQSGTAAIQLRVHGPLSSPAVTGSAHMGRATINCPFLKAPMDSFGGSVFFEDGSLRIEGLDAKVGKRGRIHVGGALPVHASKRRLMPPPVATPDDGKRAGAASGITMDVNGLELRARNVYSGAHSACS